MLFSSALTIDAAGQWLIVHYVHVLFASVVTLVIGEFVATLIRRRGFDAEGSITSVSAGLAYIVGKGIVSKLVMFGVALYIYDHHRLFDLDLAVWWVWLAMFVARDFVYYWIHRAEHRVKGLWASHLVHHSSEEFTFTTAVRMPWMEAIYKPVLGLWAPLLGFHPAAFAAIGALVLVVGQFQHTELLKGPSHLDWIFVTPSVHRVHHGSNQEYLDKNFGSMLAVWDRLFGTFQAETIPVRYGLTGGKRILGPKQALVGGYGELLREARAEGSVVGAARLVLATP